MQAHVSEAELMILSAGNAQGSSVELQFQNLKEII